MLCTTFGAFAPVHVDHHAIRVDVGDLQVERLLQAQAAGVHGGEVGAVARRANAAEHRSNLLPTEHPRQARFALGAHDVEQVSVAPQTLHEVDADAAVADAQRVGRPVIDVAPAQEVGFKLLLADVLRLLVAVELAQHAQRPAVGFLRATGLAVECQGIH